MDLTGYHGRRSSPLLQATSHAPSRKLSNRRTVSLATRGTLLLLFVLAVWAAIHRSSRTPDSPAAASSTAKPASKGGSRRVAAEVVPSAQHKAVAEGVSDTRAQALLTSRVERAMRIMPQYRGAGKVETYPQFSNANRLLLASHGRLMWYRYDTDELAVLHEGEGVYHGIFPGAERGMLGEPTTLWVVSRPHNSRPDTSKEWLLHLDMESGRELGRVQIASKWAHDAVRRRDHVYVASTGDGKVLELSFPNMTTVRELPLFTLHEHLNTLAPTSTGKLWGVLHNLGSSLLVQIDLVTGKEEVRLPNVGVKAHGLVHWGSGMLVLDSNGGALSLVDPTAGSVTQLWHLGDSSKFLKGLCVVDDIAFFGIAARTDRHNREDPALSCELAAFDLRTRLLLWRRQLPTKGLLNIGAVCPASAGGGKQLTDRSACLSPHAVAAPHLVVESTSYAVSTLEQISYRSKKAYADALDAVHQWQLQQEHEAQGMLQVEPKPDLSGGGSGDAVVLHPAAQHAGVGAAASGTTGGGVQQQQQQQQVQEQQEAGKGNRVAEVELLPPEVQQGAGLAHLEEQQQGQQQQQQASEQEQQAAHVGGQAGIVRRALIETQRLPATDPLAQYPPLLDAVRWSSGLPRFLLSAKGRRHGLAAGAQLPLFRTNTSGLKAALQELADSDWDEEVQRASNAWIDGRTKVLDMFKAGTRSILLVFSDQDGGNALRFPWYQRFAQWVEPWLLQILGPVDMNNVMRLQLAVMAPHSTIRQHMDSGGYAEAGHRIHVVVQTNPGTLGMHAQHRFPLFEA
ncbi:hypothetical protein ACK3TF_001013 [Chlorella vulgaris]